MMSRRWFRACRWRSGSKIDVWSGGTARSENYWRQAVRASRRYRTRTTRIQIWAMLTGIGPGWTWVTWARSPALKGQRSKRRTKMTRRSMSRDKAHRCSISYSNSDEVTTIRVICEWRIPQLKKTENEEGKEIRMKSIQQTRLKRLQSGCSATSWIERFAHVYKVTYVANISAVYLTSDNELHGEHVKPVSIPASVP